VSEELQRGQYYPAFLDLRGRRVVVVGGGTIAAVKVDGLLPCQPDPLVVVAPNVEPSIERAADRGLLQLVRRCYQDGDATGAWLIFGATDDAALNARVAQDGRRAGALVLAVDDPSNCDLITPALVRRGDLLLAISTSGRSPAMARYVREQLEANVPGAWARRLEVAANVRRRLRSAGRAVSAEQWQAALSAPELDELVKADSADVATEWLFRHPRFRERPVRVLSTQEGTCHPEEERRRIRDCSDMHDGTDPSTSVRMTCTRGRILRLRSG